MALSLSPYPINLVQFGHNLIANPLFKKGLSCQNLVMMDNTGMDGQISTSWIESLALDELNMEESGVIHFNDHLNPERYLEESSIQLMDHIRERFEIYVTKFNQCRSSVNQSSQIKIFKISNTINDFMLFRNTLKLVISKKANDLLSIGFISNIQGSFSARLNNQAPSINSAHEIKAHVGPFNKITWRFNGEQVDADTLVRHYLTEFIRYSAR